MSYKYTQLFYICPRDAVRKESLSDNYRDSVWDTDYANPRNIRRYLDSNPWFEEYKYAAPREAGKVVTKKEILHRLFLSEKNEYLPLKRKYRVQRPLYKEDRVEKYRDSIAEYTLPKSFVEEHKYRSIRL